MSGYNSLTTGADSVIPGISAALPVGTCCQSEVTAPSGYKQLGGDLVFTISSTGTEDTQEPSGVDKFIQFLSITGPNCPRSERLARVLKQGHMQSLPEWLRRGLFYRQTAWTSSFARRPAAESTERIMHDGNWKRLCQMERGNDFLRWNWTKQFDCVKFNCSTKRRPCFVSLRPRAFAAPVRALQSFCPG